MKSNIDSGMFRAMQLAAANALEAGEEWYEGNNKNYRNLANWQERLCVNWDVLTMRTK